MTQQQLLNKAKNLGGRKLTENCWLIMGRWFQEKKIGENHYELKCLE